MSAPIILLILQRAEVWGEMVRGILSPRQKEGGVKTALACLVWTLGSRQGCHCNGLSGASLDSFFRTQTKLALEVFQIQGI